MHHSAVTALVREGHSPFGEREVVFSCNHNGDFSGDVLITGPLGSFNFEETTEKHLHGLPGYEKIRIPFSLMEELVAEKIRKDRIAALENADDHTILYRGKDSV